MLKANILTYVSRTSEDLLIEITVNCEPATVNGYGYDKRR